MTSAEQRYAGALAGSITSSLESDPVRGDLSRLVIRWFEGPDYLTIHALGTEDERDVPKDDAWYPLDGRTRITRSIASTPSYRTRR